jgi:replicative DNA helicase
MPTASDDAPFADHAVERAVLGAVLLAGDRGTYARAAECASADDFDAPAHRMIWSAMGVVAARGDSLDVATVADELRRAERLNTVGGAQYLAELTDALPSPAFVETHAKIVRRLADCRRADIALARARRDLRTAVDPAEVLAKVSDSLRDTAAKSQRARTGGPRSMLLHALDAHQSIESGSAPGMSLGLAGLNRVTGGLFGGQVVVVAGVQGHGKTSWLTQAMRVNAEDFAKAGKGDRIAWWSLEMSGREVLYRQVTWEHELAPGELRARGPKHIGKAEMTFERWGELPIDLDGDSCPTALDVRSYLYAHPEVKIACVDWLGLMAPHPDAPKGAKDFEHAALNTKTLKGVARTRDVAIVILNQFDQESNRKGAWGMHSMLGGAAVVNNADTILVMRPAETKDQKHTPTHLPLDIGIVKARAGRTGIVKAMFDKTRGVFIELTSSDDEERYAAAVAETDERPDDFEFDESQAYR